MKHSLTHACAKVCWENDHHTSLPQGKLFTAVSCLCLAVNNSRRSQRIFKPGNAFKKAFSIVSCLHATDLNCNCNYWCCSLALSLGGLAKIRLTCWSSLIQWEWPVRQHTGLTKNVENPCRQFLSCLSPTLLAACFRSFAGLLASLNCQATQDRFQTSDSAILKSLMLRDIEKVSHRANIQILRICC